MSAVEVLNEIRKLRGKFNKSFGISTSEMNVMTVCLDNKNCVQLYNYRMELAYDVNGNINNITVNGVDQNGNLRTFTRELVYDVDGNLVNINEWVEI